MGWLIYVACWINQTGKHQVGLLPDLVLLETEFHSSVATVEQQ